MSAENLSEAISVQGRPLEAHQALPSRPRSAADASTSAGRRDREHDVDRRRDDINVSSNLFKQRRPQNYDVASAQNDARNFRRERPRQHPRFNIVRVDFNNNDLRKRKRNLHRRRPKVALCSTSSSTSGATSRAFGLRVF